MSESEKPIANLLEQFNATTLAGFCFLVGGIQWFLGILAAESWYDGYSSRIDYVSELGTGPTELIYNSSVFLLGVFVLIGTVFLYRAQEKKLLTVLLIICSIGIMGVGVFPADMRPMHGIATPIAILFGALSAIASYSSSEKPMSIISVILGLMSFVLAFLFLPYLGLDTGATDTFMGMAKGSMERWAINPILAWIIAFGGYLLGSVNKD
jgi:hypothetical membrane protein